MTKYHALDNQKRYSALMINNWIQAGIAGISYNHKKCK